MLSPSELKEMVGEPGEGWADLQGKPIPSEESEGEAASLASHSLQDVSALHKNVNAQVLKVFPIVDDTTANGQKISRLSLLRLRDAITTEIQRNTWLYLATCESQLHILFSMALRAVYSAGHLSPELI